MLLAGYKENENWIFSRWNLTYKAGWNSICKAVYAAYDDFEEPEILLADEAAAIADRKEILKLDEKSTLAIRGLSKTVKVPLMMTFYNQLDAVDVTIAKASSEFMEADYQRLNMSLCQYLSSIEISMYRTEG